MSVVLVSGAFAASTESNPVIPFLAITGRPTDAEIAHKITALKEDGFDQFLIYYYFVLSPTPLTLRGAVPHHLFRRRS